MLALTGDPGQQVTILLGRKAYKVRLMPPSLMCYSQAICQ